MLYETDEEKVETIKKWWKENGLSVVAGALIGLGAIYSWRYWIEYKDNVASKASAVFEQLINDAQTGKAEDIAKRAKSLQDEFGSTPYPALGSLVSAKALYDAGKADDAIAALQRVIDDAPDPAIARIAALRMARIQVSEGKLDAAAKTVDAHGGSPAFAAEFAVVRGDIAATRGDVAAARAAYQEALDKDAGLSQLIRLKLDNLPAAG